MSRVRKRLEQYKQELERQTQYKAGLPGSALDIVNTLLADLEEDEAEERKKPADQLPLKIGDTIWDNDFGFPTSYKITAYSFGHCDEFIESDIQDELMYYVSNDRGSVTGSFPVSEIGKHVFTSREEAEKNLLKIEGDK